MIRKATEKDISAVAGIYDEILSIEAVSYTHLDVYKRQELARGVFLWRLWCLLL